MKLNQTNVISSVILVASLLAIGQFMLVSASFLRRPKPSIRQAKSKMGLPLNSMIEDADHIQEQKALVEKVELNMKRANDESVLGARPNDQKIESEVVANPHQVPASLLDFSVLVAGKMDQAKKNFVYAEALFSEFRQCAVQDNHEAFQNLALRAYCLANAKRLVGWYPDLANQWNSLSSQVSRQLMDLVDLTQG